MGSVTLRSGNQIRTLLVVKTSLSIINQPSTSGKITSLIWGIRAWIFIQVDRKDVPCFFFLQIYIFIFQILKCVFFQQVTIDVPDLPAVINEYQLKCMFNGISNNAVLKDGLISCALPDPSSIPPTPETEGKHFYPMILSYKATSFITLLCSGLSAAWFCTLHSQRSNDM